MRLELEMKLIIKIKTKMIHNVEGPAYDNFKSMNKFLNRKKWSSNKRKREKSKKNGNKKIKGLYFVSEKLGHLVKTWLLL